MCVPEFCPYPAQPSCCLFKPHTNKSPVAAAEWVTLLSDMLLKRLLPHTSRYVQALAFCVGRCGAAHHQAAACNRLTLDLLTMQKCTWDANGKAGQGHGSIPQWSDFSDE